MTIESNSSYWITSSTWPISSTPNTWSAPVTFTQNGESVIADLRGSVHGIHGVGCTRAEALADLRAAIREFACVLGVVPCRDHKAP